MRLATALATLNWLDALSTHSLIKAGIAYEANPIASRLYEFRPELFLLFKMAISLFVLTAPVEKMRNSNRVLGVLVAFYVLVVCWHAYIWMTS